MNVPIIRRGNFYSTSEDLNFYIIAQPDQPQDPMENTIWINTDVEMTKWCFSITEPIEPIEGMVWIVTGSASSTAFNLSSNNQITIYPVKAYQYISDAWIPVIGQSYINEMWNDWVTFLYNRGNTCSDITGGYSNTAVPYIESGSGGQLRITYNSDHILIKPNASAYVSGLFRTSQKIDFTNFNKLVIVMDLVNDSSHLKLFTFSSIGSYCLQKYSSMTTLEQTGTGLKMVEINISELTGSHYVGFCIYPYAANSSAPSAKVYEIYCQ